MPIDTAGLAGDRPTSATPADGHGGAGIAADERWRATTAAAAGIGGVYQGWINVVLGVVVVLIVAGTTSYSFGLFIKPVSAELHLSRAGTNLGLVLFHLGSALFSPVTGRLLDRLPILRLLRLGAVLFGGGIAALGFVASPAAMGLLIVGPVALGAALAGPVFANVLVSRWFTALRGRALTLTALGTSLGGMIVFPIMAALIASFTWRTALVATGVGGGLVLFIVSLLARDRPIAARRAAPGDGTAMAGDAPRTVEAVRLTPWQILARRDFWFIAVSVCLLLGVDQALLATITPYAQDRGFTLGRTAAIMSATTASAIAGKLLLAWVADRIDLRRLLVVTALCSIVMCVTLHFAPGYVMLFAVSCLTGLAVGGTFPVGNAMLARRFGAASVGAAIGLQVPIIAVAAMGSVYFVGLMHDRHGSYDVAFQVFAGAAVLAIGLVPFIRLPRPPRPDTSPVGARAD